MHRLILTALLLIILATPGCLTTGTTAMPPKPIKPTLEFTAGPDNGICLDGENTYLLLDYIWRLEEGYER